MSADPFAPWGDIAQGFTAADVAAFMSTEPKWDFAANPWAAVGHATEVASQHALDGRNAKAATWTKIGLLLVAAANVPHVYVGHVLGELASDYGIQR